MMMMKWQLSLTLLLSLLLFNSFVPTVVGYGEPDASGHPNYQERANHVFLNAVRIAPTQYKNVYMTGYSPSPASILGSTYPARPPVYLEPRLVSAAYFHSNDLGTNGCFSHNSCNGTATFTRIRYFYSCSGTMGENIAAGYADPLDTNNQWLCDAVGGACAADGSANDGHRANIMNGGYRVVGTGYANVPSSTYRHYWTQDFGGASCPPVPTSPIYGASHRVKSGTTRFIAVYYTNPAVAPASATITIAGTSNPLALDIGASGAGTYFFSQTAGTGCRSYYFTFGTYRYPETGCLVTYGEGQCTTSFDATCGGTTSATASTSSTSAATTTTAATSATTATVAATSTTAATTAATSTTAATTAATSTTAATTAVTSTTAAVTTAASTTGSGSGYFVYTSSLQNSWVVQYNSGVSISHSFTYSGTVGFRAVLLASSNTNNNFVWFTRNPAITNTFTTLQFNVAASTNANVRIFFNGGYLVTRAATTAWQSYSIPLSSLNPGSVLGGSSKQLVFQNSLSSGITLYLNNIRFV